MKINLYGGVDKRRYENENEVKALNFFSSEKAEKLNRDLIGLRRISVL